MIDKATIVFNNLGMSLSRKGFSFSVHINRSRLIAKIENPAHEAYHFETDDPSNLGALVKWCTEVACPTQK